METVMNMTTAKEIRRDERNIKVMEDFTSPEELYQELIRSVARYHPSADISMIEKAFQIAMDAHKDQVRKSGEPYIIHPLAVAQIVAEELRLDSESIEAALLHDVCKTDLYVRAVRKRRNEIGVYEAQEIYEIHDENFPVGHGEKSAMILLRSGLDLSDDELCAIRWHMGPWNLSKDDEKFYRQAGKRSPLAPLIHTADTMASSLLERPSISLK